MPGTFKTYTLPRALPSRLPRKIPLYVSKALSLVEAAPGAAVVGGAGGVAQTGKAAAGGARGALGARELSYYCGPHDLKRLELYSRNLVRER